MKQNFFLLLLLAFASSLQAAQPNIVIILADDLGWGDPTCYNAASKIKTTAIDRLANEGMRFTDAHTPSSVCTPTRYTLLTGRYCWRTRLKSGVLDGFSPPLIEDNEFTIARWLKARGYATACIGKWHLGMQWTRTDGTPESIDRRPKGFRPGENIDFAKPLTGGPLTAGFDFFQGISASLDMPPYCWIDQDRCMPAPDGSVPTAKDTIFLNQSGGAAHSGFRIDKVLPTLKTNAAKWLRDHQTQSPDKPFFLYLPLTSPHLPVAPSNAFKGKSGAGDYADFVLETDDFVATIDQTLREIGRHENTLVVFTSDNGGLWHRWRPAEADDVKHYKPTPRAQYNAQYNHFSNTHLRGTKADIWEGGHRVPFIVRWPDGIFPGQVSDQIVELTDVSATIIELLGEKKAAGEAVDGFSMLPQLKGIDKPVRSFAIHHSLRGNFAIRQGDWKLMSHRGSGGFSLPRKIQPQPDQPAGQLYNLKIDPSETKNVWMQNPKIVNALRIKLGDITTPLPRQKIEVTSSMDGTSQPSILILPDDLTKPTPLVVSLHSWSTNMNLRNYLEFMVHQKGWIYLAPNFRGANKTPAACASELAQKDILDAVDFVCEKYSVDKEQIFLTGTSGGGHMTMMMSAKAPKRWRAASAWVGISDLANWYAKHKGSKYGNMMEQCCGGALGDSAEIDQQYRNRSPIHFLPAAASVALDISAGIRDGHTGSVPIKHSIDAFNAIAQANGTPQVSAAEIAQLSRKRSDGLSDPQPGDVGFDPSFGRKFYLRRKSKNARLTIFDGDHEGIAEATMAWFEQAIAH